jgi:hypothetical protein
MVIVTPRVIPGQTGGGYWSTAVESMKTIRNDQTHQLSEPAPVREYIWRMDGGQPEHPALERLRPAPQPEARDRPERPAAPAAQR